MPTSLPEVTLATRYYRAMTRLKQHSLIRSAAQFIRNKLNPSPPSFGQQAAHAAACPGSGRLMLPANKAPAIPAISLMTGSGDKDKSGQWNIAAGAAVLRGSNESWKNFFDKDFVSPAELLAAIPEDATQSPATIMNYYLAFHPEKARARQWNTAANAAVLRESNEDWKNFFDQDFAAPADLLLAIPEDTKQSPATIMHYYLSLHPKKGKARQWINAAGAVVLRESNKGWKNFFDQDFASPAELLAAIPEDAKQSPATIMHYYLALHPEKEKARLWNTAASAAVLRESNEAWKNLFDQDFTAPVELLLAIPEDATQSPATIMNYYLALHPETEKARQWIITVSAIVFALKYPFFQRANLTGLDLREARELQGLSISINTLRIYLGEISKIEFSLSKFMRLSPALRWWKENPKAHRRAKKLIARGAAAKSEFLLDKTISNAIKRSKIKPKTFLDHLAVLRRYVEERIELPTSSPSAQRQPQF